ncbi:hypothetical protein [Streptomyces sp. NPDC056192]|uniref:hypothetical protein n=1 Tax=Streptomyces sp. NPDC056192 TaxID=3345743 RepID=UPI0035DCC189
MNARAELYAYGTAAFDTGVPPVIHDRLTKLLNAYKAEVLREGANALVAGPVDSLVSAAAAWVEAVETLRRIADEIDAPKSSEALSGLFERLGPPKQTEPGAIEYGVAFKANEQDDIEVHTPTDSRHEAEARVTRYLDMYPTAYLVQRTVRHGAWTDVAAS